jgi:F420-dependent oxidoreductase-like protein
MQLRIFTEPQQGASYADLLAVAKATEDLGFDAFFRSDHYLVMGDGDGRPGPSDAWTTLAGLARDTNRIRLGTLVSPITFRHPGPLAIAVANIDEMSGGRVELGLGAGWFEAEHAAYGLEFPPMNVRYDQLEEQLTVIDGLWRTPLGEKFSFAGEHYQVTDSPALPKPVQSPRPPIILGGAAKKRGAALAARFADDFNIGFANVEDTAARMASVQAARAEIDAQHDIVYSWAQTTVVGATDVELTRRAAAIGRSVDELRRNALAGSPAEIVDQIGRYAELGITRVYLQIMDLADLEHLELIAAQVAPQLP